MVQPTFWAILGAGLAIPGTLILIFNLALKMINGEKYVLSFPKLGILYGISLIGWASLFGIH